MQNALDGGTLEFPCPKCGKAIRNTVGWFRRTDVKCPSCGLPFDTTKFAAEIAKAEKAVDDLRRDLRNMKF